MLLSWLKLPSVAVISALLLTACQKSDDKATHNAQTDNQTAPAVLKVGTEGAYKPFNYKNAQGELVGFDVDIAHALCEDMQVKCEIVAQDWEGIIPALNAKKFDAIIAGMSITPERQTQVDFTEPYFNNSLVFVAKKDSNFDPSDANQINGKNISAQRATISSQWLEQNYPNAEDKLYDTLDNAFLDLGSGRVDAMIADKAPALAWLKSPEGANFSIKGQEIDINDKMAIAVRKNDVWLAKINTSLANLKANGTYDKISQKYFAEGGDSNTNVASTATK